MSLLLMCMVIGFIVKNYSDVGDMFTGSIEGGSVGIYIIFFALAGVDLDFTVLSQIWLLAVSYAIVRGLFLFLGTYLGAIITKSEKPVKIGAWTGFVGQAGVSLGLISLTHKDIPKIGAIITPLVISAIVINQVIGPIIFKYTINKTRPNKSEISV